MTTSVICATIKPKSKQDELKIAEAMKQFANAGAGPRLRLEPESGALVLLGSSPSELSETVARLSGDFGVEAHIEPFRVFYRASIRDAVREEARFTREVAGRRQFAHCVLEIAPRPNWDGIEFVNATTDSGVSEYARAIEGGVRRAMEAGLLDGYPIVGIKATLTGGSVEAGSDAQAFEIAGGIALRAACMKARPFLLEPVMACVTERSTIDSPSRLIPLSELLKGAGGERVEAKLSHFSPLHDA